MGVLYLLSTSAFLFSTGVRMFEWLAVRLVIYAKAND